MEKIYNPSAELHILQPDCRRCWQEQRILARRLLVFDEICDFDNVWAASRQRKPIVPGTSYKGL